MQKRTAAIAVTLFVLAGCAAQTPDVAVEEASPYAIPPEVIALAGPNQDLFSAEFDATDGCYWYYHAGQVETTRVPLRAANGNQICNAPSA
ncbi:hypothetical protein [Paracoccus xiamenensis]|uniref:hypothetical protein n=1 Tax=Paracoccus xiamenensis TaxID=2714901 RepID=UPI0014081415|nr:hypothetical protein [Paracoccus xiamenensis]NHF74425.1 hypothetical protein [Paracoccus xiamenensis]